jgi:GR25 family glycosyltransferase involved in LPS biosynthesis
MVIWKPQFRYAEDLLSTISGRIAVVGNSTPLEDYGVIIDRYDCVIRFNNYQTKGFEQKVGTRCDIRSVSGWHDVEHRSGIPEISPFSADSRESSNLSAFNKINEIPVLPARIDIHPLIPETPNPSSGLALVQLLCELGLKADLFCFDAFQSHHYWEGKKEGRIITSHSAKELEIIRNRKNVHLIGDFTSSNNKGNQSKELETVCKNNPDKHAMQASVTRQAAELLKNGYFASALEKYVSLQEATGLAAWDYQISFLEKKLGLRHPLAGFAKVLQTRLGVERLYVLNMAHRPDRRARAARELARAGFQPAEIQFLEGVHGEKDERALAMNLRFQTAQTLHERLSVPISPEALAYDREHSTPGVFGYLLSQNEILRDALRNGYKKIAVFDDDVFFSPQATTILEKFASRDLEWELLLLGASNYHDYQAENLETLTAAESAGYYHPIPLITCGSFAVCYESTIIPLLLELVNEYAGYFDRHILCALYANMSDKCYALWPAACCADVSQSEIRTPRDINLHSEQMGWDISRFEEYRLPLN